MKEIEYSIRRAGEWRRYLDKNGATNINYDEWCLNTGLWETLGWTNDVVRSDVFKWLITGKNRFDV